MKTTVHLPDDLLSRAKSLARRDGTTLKALLEEGLRWCLDRRSLRRPFRLHLATFHGKGLHPDAKDGSWDAIRALVYEGRGGS